ncbi:hypothetical protein EC973_002623 [Apophysomyces ossiformis]|uniref:Uncharacterized protein n=1 Tax=Apophysomyces ossiformis TaxID=679940 RepID=A0A8H7BNF4_9FUNG|nr:hypothetical protein EC973_002623 [Apophysomyces ossiformis]
MAMIYLVSLLQETPLPHPAKRYTVRNHDDPHHRPNEMLLSTVGEFIYLTSVYFDYTPKDREGYTHGVGRQKVGVAGLVRQVRKPLRLFLDKKDSIVDDDWELVFDHTFSGPITKISRTPDKERFAMLYNVLEDQSTKYFVRMYYIADGVFEYKDMVLPGNTWIETFSLEDGLIIYARDPDSHRFRIVFLPENIMSAPHSDNAAIVPLGPSIAGDPMKRWHQPSKALDHSIVLSGLYSSDPDTLRIFSLEVHKTTQSYFVNAILADLLDGTWVRRVQGNSSHEIYRDESFEQMVLVDGGYYQQKRVLLHMPKLSFARSKDAKTVVTPYMKNMFLTLDYTNQADALKFNKEESQYLFKNNGTIIPDYYLWLEDAVVSSHEVFDADIVGLTVNDHGTTLAIWTENDWVCVFQRESPHDQIIQYPWEPKMAIDQIRSVSGPLPVKSVMLWNDGSEKGADYIFLALENGIVQSYSLNETEKQRPVSFRSFLQDQWPLWTVMSLVISVYVINEVQHHPS